MAYIETRASQLELQKPEKDPSEVTTDDILDEIGRKSFHIWKIFVLTSFTWAITAPLVMIGAFIDDPSCDYSNLKNLTKDCLERKSGSLGSGVAVWILGYESIPSVLRPYATFSFGSTWVIGYCAVAPLAYYVKEWRWLIESFPTKERNICIGICSVIGKLVGSSAPFIQTTADIWDPLPLVIFGSFSAVAGLITLFLPETNHKQLPDTVENMS
ncbi:hypothetical protein FO519_005103 [Halicephalobus sp. NKZ332]|nr:hypothetical protein FO519_005103 [Halicephalobus sp. NKZ332]